MADATPWREVALGRGAGLTARTPQPFAGRRPYLATADVQDSVARPAEEVEFVRMPARAGLQLAEGDVLQAKMFATDKAFRVTVAEDGWLASTGFAQFVPAAAGSDPSFVFHYLRSPAFHRAKNRRCVGSTQQAISQGDLCALTVCLPTLQEQRAIGRVLDAADRAMRSTEALVRKNRSIRAGLLHDLFAYGVDEAGRIRDPARDAFDLTDAGLLPHGWSRRALERLADPQAPIGYGIVQVFEDVPGGVPVLAIKDLVGDFTTDIHRSAPAIDAQYARSRVQPGDVLISVKGTIGRIALVPAHYSGNISRDLARVRPANGVNGEWLMHLLRSPRGQKILELAQVGTTRAELSIGPLRKLEFPFPPGPEQARIASILTGQDTMIAELEAKAEKLWRTMLGLMADLLSGAVRVGPGVMGG